jgi:hypothetical protein
MVALSAAGATALAGGAAWAGGVWVAAGGGVDAAFFSRFWQLVKNRIVIKQRRIVRRIMARTSNPQEASRIQLAESISLGDSGVPEGPGQIVPVGCRG